MSNDQNSTKSGTCKKKKPRQRNRPRNKRNRLEDNDIQTQNPSAMLGERNNQQQQSAAADKGKKQQQQSSAADIGGEHVIAVGEAKEQGKLDNILQKPLATKIITEVERTTITRKLTTTTTTTTNDETTATATVVDSGNTVSRDNNATDKLEKTREQIKAEREAKKAAKQAAKSAKASVNIADVTQKLDNLQSVFKTANVESTASRADLTVESEKKKSALSKAERRAIQEAQRAAKAQAQAQVETKKTANKLNVVKSGKGITETSVIVNATSSQDLKQGSESPAKSTLNEEKESKVKLFNHVVCADKVASLFINDALVHPSMVRLGVQYAQRTIVGSNARCIAFLYALRQVVQDFETPAQKEFGRSLDAAVKCHVDHLHKCRPLAVSVFNAYKQFKNQLTQLPADKPETELKEQLVSFIDTYIENQIVKAAEAISISVQEKISDGDVLLTFACSSLIQFICEQAKKRNVAFRVIVVDSHPFCEGQEMLRRLHSYGIPSTYVLINAVGFVMPEATKVMLGAHALLANGYVMARTGTAQVALVANAHNVPVLVCCETHKFSERFQTDAIVYNELCDPNQLVVNAECSLSNWQSKERLKPLNLSYDITPPELVSAVVTEVAILPCTSVPVILRIKPDFNY